MFKCIACGLVLKNKPEVCPKCGAKDFVELTADQSALLEKSRETNNIYAAIIKSAAKLQKISEEGIKYNLDPACFATFHKIKDMAYLMEQMSKAEIGTHVTKNKF